MIPIALKQWFSVRGDYHPQRPLAMFEDRFGCQSWWRAAGVGEEGKVFKGREGGDATVLQQAESGLLLSILQCIGQPKQRIF